MFHPGGWVLLDPLCVEQGQFVVAPLAGPLSLAVFPRLNLRSAASPAGRSSVSRLCSWDPWCRPAWALLTSAPGSQALGGEGPILFVSVFLSHYRLVILEKTVKMSPHRQLLSFWTLNLILISVLVSGHAHLSSTLGPWSPSPSIDE